MCCMHGILDDNVPCDVPILSVGHHTHPANEEHNQRELIADRIVQQVRMNPSVPARRVYDAVVDNLSSSESDDAPAFRFAFTVVTSVGFITGPCLRME